MIRDWYRADLPWATVHSSPPWIRPVAVSRSDRPCVRGNCTLRTCTAKPARTHTHSDDVSPGAAEIHTSSVSVGFSVDRNRWRVNFCERRKSFPADLCRHAAYLAWNNRTDNIRRLLLHVDFKEMYHNYYYYYHHHHHHHQLLKLNARRCQLRISTQIVMSPFHIGAIC